MTFDDLQPDYLHSMFKTCNNGVSFVTVEVLGTWSDNVGCEGMIVLLNLCERLEVFESVISTESTSEEDHTNRGH